MQMCCPLARYLVTEWHALKCLIEHYQNYPSTIHQRHVGCGRLFQHALGERQECTLDSSPIYRRAQTPFTHTLIPTSNLLSPISLPSSLNCGWKPEYPGGNPRRHANSTPKGPGWDSNQRPSCTMPPININIILCI